MLRHFCSRSGELVAAVLFGGGPGFVHAKLKGSELGGLLKNLHPGLFGGLLQPLQ